MAKGFTLLHTSDWHLGQKFIYQDREAEHELALDWLLSVILEKGVDALIVAGDIFDIGNPPNYARRLYYRLLTSLLDTDCKHVIIVGGNHDSPAMLEAPRDLLAQLRVRVVGAASENPQRDILELHSSSGTLEAVVAAVPFLRDRDLHYSVAAEGGQARITRIQEGIRAHYERMAALVAPYQAQGVPILTTGHLYATGAQASGRQDNIYIGNVENIEARHLPEIFDYVALGHIHRPQRLDKQGRVRYSGSLIPLSFSETQDEKGVYHVTFGQGKLPAVDWVAAPTFRRLKTITGDLETVQQKLRAFADRQEPGGLTAWVEVVLELDAFVPQLDVLLQEFAEDMPLELLKIRIDRQYRGLYEQLPAPDLVLLEQELEVFRRRCRSYGAPPEEMPELEATFLELRDWIQEQDET